VEGRGNKGNMNDIFQNLFLLFACDENVTVTYLSSNELEDMLGFTIS